MGESDEIGYSRKKPKRWVEDILFLNPWGVSLWKFWVFYFTPGNSKQSKSSPLETAQNFVTPLWNFKA